jgi:hypothetical protein
VKGSKVQGEGVQALRRSGVKGCQMTNNFYDKAETYTLPVNELVVEGEIDMIPGHVLNERYEAIFYGRGRGIHSTTPFNGPLVKEILEKYFPVSSMNMQTGILCFAGLDGYRCAVSFSELFNRNDQQEFLLVKMEKDSDGGEFRMFAACDFFSDRAVKSLSEIHLGF